MVCRELGLSGGEVYSSDDYDYSEDLYIWLDGMTCAETEETVAEDLYIWLDGITCDGTEETVAACTLPTWSEHDCSDSEVVYVLCDFNDELTCDEEGQTRLMGQDGPHEREGRLEICHENQWGEFV